MRLCYLWKVLWRFTILLCFCGFYFHGTSVCFDPFGDRHPFIQQSVWLTKRFNSWQARPGGSVVSVSDLWPDGCEFDPRFRRTFFPAYFRLSPLKKHVRKVVCGFGKKVVLVLVWESHSGKHMCVTDRHNMTLAVKVTLNNQPTNQPIELIAACMEYTIWHRSINFSSVLNVYKAIFMS